MIANVIVTVIILGLVLWACMYIRKSLKKGQCIGCPHAKECGKKCSCASRGKG